MGRAMKIILTDEKRDYIANEIRRKYYSLHYDKAFVDAYLDFKGYDSKGTDLILRARTSSTEYYNYLSALADALVDVNISDSALAEALLDGNMPDSHKVIYDIMRISEKEKITIRVSAKKNALVAFCDRYIGNNS